MQPIASFSGAASGSEASSPVIPRPMTDAEKVLLCREYLDERVRLHKEDGDPGRQRELKRLTNACMATRFDIWAEAAFGA